MAGLTGNTKDTGNKNVRVDFAFGNIPTAPNDDRGGNTLDLTASTHSDASFAWNGYPLYNTPNTNGTKYVVPAYTLNTTTRTAFTTALTNAGFDVVNDVAWSTAAGGTANTLKTVSSAAASVVIPKKGTPALTIVVNGG